MAQQVEDNEVTDFTTMDLDDDNFIDLQKSLPNLIGVVSEKEGGIIAYAIGQEHADQIQQALVLWEVVKDI